MVLSSIIIRQFFNIIYSDYINIPRSAPTNYKIICDIIDYIASFPIRLMEENNNTNIPSPTSPPLSSRRNTSLISRKYRDCSANRQFSTECSICIDKFSKSSDVIQLECNHIFHEECIKQWLKTSKTCPVCRKRVNITISDQEINIIPNGTYTGIRSLRRFTSTGRDLNNEIVRIITYLPNTNRYRVQLNDGGLYDIRPSNLSNYR